jgi:hypothetical protein
VSEELSELMEKIEDHEVVVAAADDPFHTWNIYAKYRLSIKAEAEIVCSRYVGDPDYR